MFAYLARLALLAVVPLVVIVQLLPFGRDHVNPATRTEPQWDSPQTRDLAVRACFDCHSNETAWPWYSNVAPVSWLIQRDVSSGRRHLNFSEWNRPQRETRGAGKQVQEGEMPPFYYVLMHPEASLSAAEKALLAGGIQKTLGGATQPSRGQESRVGR